MQQPSLSESDNIYEVRFKNTRKSFFRNVNALPLITGDYVVVESDRGFDVGQISLGGILARLQMRKRKVRMESDRVLKIYRRATKEDIEKLFKAREREPHTLIRTREIIRELDLDMKLSDVEYQGDNTKTIFYYIADTRVDFRELIKRLANEFRIRVEMKQIGLRHESGLIGGIGSCGRELCCTTWLTDFKTVSTGAARYQNLSLNPMKISGQCGRLKCCLNFELEAYLDALKDIPKIDRIETQMGIAYLQKTDIFKKTMWFSYPGDSNWIAVTADKVILLTEMNQSGIKPASLHILDVAPEIDDKDLPMDFVDVVGQSVLREDPKRKKNRKGKGGGQGPNARQGAPDGQSQKGQRPQRRPEGQGSGQGPRQERRQDGPKRERPEGGGPEQPRGRDQQRPAGENRNQGRSRNERGGRGSGNAVEGSSQANPQGNPQGERQPRKDGRDQNRRRPDGRGNNRQEGRPRGEGRPPRDQNKSDNNGPAAE